MKVVVVIDNTKKELFKTVITKEIVNTKCGHYIPDYKNFKYCPHCARLFETEDEDVKINSELKEFTETTFSYQDKIYAVTTEGYRCNPIEKIFIEILEIEDVEDILESESVEQDLVGAIELSKVIAAKLKNAGFHAVGGISYQDY